jgi:hypothetical protein
MTYPVLCRMVSEEEDHVTYCTLLALCPFFTGYAALEISVEFHLECGACPGGGRQSREGRVMEEMQMLQVNESVVENYTLATSGAF